MTSRFETALQMIAIENAGNKYRVRKYAGRFIPVIEIDGKVKTFNPQNSSYIAMTIARLECAKASGWVAENA